MKCLEDVIPGANVLETFLWHAQVHYVADPVCSGSLLQKLVQEVCRLAAIGEVERQPSELLESAQPETRAFAISRG